MQKIACPSCKSAMEIDAAEANTEWECPACGAAFLVQGPADDLKILITQNATKQVAAPTAGKYEPLPSFDKSEPEIKEDIYVYALESLLKGQKPGEVRKSLLEAGFTGRQADQILQTALKFKREGEAQEQLTAGVNSGAGRRNMMIGGVICVIGIVVTIGTMAAATRTGGGSVYVAWGAIVFGGIQFFRGLHQAMNA